MEKRIVIEKKEDNILGIGLLFASKNNKIDIGTGSLIQMSVSNEIIEDESLRSLIPE